MGLHRPHSSRSGQRGYSYFWKTPPCEVLLRVGRVLAHYALDYEHQRLRFEDGAVFGTRVPFDASSRSILLVADNLRLLLDTGATGVFLFRSEGLDLEVNARAIKRVSTNAGHRIAKSGWLERVDIGDVSLHRVPVTLVPETGLESKADGLLPGTLFDAIYFDHENDFVVFNSEDDD